MKRNFVYIPVFTFFFLLLFSCNDKRQGKKSTLDDCPVIAYRNGSLTVLDISSLKDTVSVPLSSLLSDFEIIRLENSDEAIVGHTMAHAISSNYLGLYSEKEYKLFKRNGEFVRTITSSGQGPNEFWIAIYDSYIDEENNRIYLLSFRANKLLVFDLEGNALQHIPFPYTVHKGRFRIDTEKRELLVTVLPFSDNPLVVWKQDFDGNILQGVDVGHFALERGNYNNEVGHSQNTAVMDFSLIYWQHRVDSLYHYDEEKNVLESVFTIDWKNRDVLGHIYTELPNHYLVRFFSTTPALNPVLIDKDNLRGSYVKIKFDMLGNIDADWLSFDRGYFHCSMFPYDLKEKMKKALARPEVLTLEMKEKLIKFNNSLTEDDNNVIFLGKLKK